MKAQESLTLSRDSESGHPEWKSTASPPIQLLTRLHSAVTATNLLQTKLARVLNQDKHCNAVIFEHQKIADFALRLLVKSPVLQ